MGYAVSESIVRVDRFRASGKWYDSWAINMNGYYEYPGIHEALRLAMKDAGMPFEEWIVVCLEPYHKHSHPLLLMPLKEGG